MSATTDLDQERAAARLADEVHDLAAHEEALERRTRSLELAGPLALVFSVSALALAIGALTVALGNRFGRTSSATASGAPSAAAARWPAP